MRMQRVSSVMLSLASAAAKALPGCQRVSQEGADASRVTLKGGSKRFSSKLFAQLPRTVL